MAKLTLTPEHISKVVNKLNAKTVIDPNTNCWLWQGHIHGDYGRMIYEHTKLFTHVWSAWIYLNAKPGNNLTICHKRVCPNKHCWNPEHLYVGTPQTNMDDCIALGNHHLKNKIHCPKGHLLDTSYFDYERGKPHRYCSKCRRARVQAWRARKQKAGLVKS